jgi:F0F1-type ATP synthase delta subunit
MLADSADLRRLLTSPAFTGEKRQGPDRRRRQGQASPITRKFLGLLAANGRTATCCRARSPASWPCRPSVAASSPPK